MRAWLTALDRILRGDATRLGNLREGSLDVPLAGMTVLIVVLGAVYGMGVGSFALFKETGPTVAQFLAAAVKIPALFLLTLVVTFPSLYVFNALVGSRLSLLSVLRLLIAGLAVMVAVLASFGPIVAFFSVSTTSYPFMKLLNVLMCTVAGVLGLSFLLQTLHRLTISRLKPIVAPPSEPAINPQASQPPPLSAGALDPVEGHVLAAHVKAVFRCWIVLFALVGSQMSWVLRPFIGDPNLPFTFFRPRESNFFQSVWEALTSLLG